MRGWPTPSWMPTAAMLEVRQREHMGAEKELPPPWPSAMFTPKHVYNLFCQTIRCSQERNLQVSCLFEYSEYSVSAETLTFFPWAATPVDLSAEFTLVMKAKEVTESVWQSAKCQLYGLNCVCSCSQLNSVAPSTSPAAYWEARPTATVGERVRLITRVSSTRL